MNHGMGSRLEDGGAESNNRIGLLNRMKHKLPVGTVMVVEGKCGVIIPY